MVKGLRGKFLSTMLNALVFFLAYREFVCDLLYCKGLKCTFGIRVVIGFRGIPLLLRVRLSWVCDIPGFNGRSTVVTLAVKENGE
jgi:hypothetical protein